MYVSHRRPESGQIRRHYKMRIGGMYWVRVSVLLTGLNEFGHIVVKSVACETYNESGEVKASNYAGGFKAILQKEVHQSSHLMFSKVV